MRQFYFLRILILFSLFGTSFSSYAQQMMFGMASEGGDSGAGAIIMTNEDGSELELIHSFNIIQGKGPMNTQLVEAADGKLYGMTNQGGPALKGVLFSFDPATEGYEIHVAFDGASKGASPYGSLLLASDGKMYGMTYVGGANDQGVIFSFDPSTNEFIKSYDFEAASGRNPLGSLVEGNDGLLYGVTYEGGTLDAGVLFNYNPVTSEYTRLKDFGNTVGSKPHQGLTLLGDKFYGMTSEGGTGSSGTIYEYDHSNNSLTTVYDFAGTDGATPLGILTAATNGMLYGMTLSGGANSAGVIFKFGPDEHDYTKLFDFNEEGGIAPYGSLFQAADGKLYGVTEQGVEGSGGLFTYDLSSGEFNNVVSFYYLDTGTASRTTLMQASNGKLYGMTSSGGRGDEGVLFEYDPVTDDFQKKVEMGIAEDGKWPQGDLIQGENGKLYGTTYDGGVNRMGVLFEYDITNQKYTKKFDFDFESGYSAMSKLVSASNGKLYGFTRGGGNNSRGVLFQYDPQMNVYSKKFEFTEETGTAYGMPVLIEESKVYGVTGSGGAHNNGILFEYDLESNEFVKKADFESVATGRSAISGLVHFDGKLYGLTEYGGSEDGGVLFQYDLQTSVLSKLVDFTGTDTGVGPVGNLTVVNGKLYGHTNAGGSFDSGVIFEFDPATNDLVKKYDFTNDFAQGVDIVGGLVASGNGKLYGATAQGGVDNLGVFYEFDITTGTFTKKTDFIGANGARVSGAFIYVSMEYQNLTFNPLDEKMYGDAAFVLQTTVDSDLPVTYSSSNPNVASIEGNTVTIHNAGTAVLTASQPGSKNYHPAAVEQTLTVNKASQTVSFDALSEKTFGDAAFALAASSSAELPVTYTSSNPGVATVSDGIVTIVGAGSTVITASQAGDDNYLPATEVPQNLVVNKLQQVITFTDLPEQQFGTESFALTGAINSPLEIIYTSSDPDVATIDGNMVTIVGVGTTDITASQTGDDNHIAATDVIQTFTVTKGDQVIEFAQLEDRHNMDEPFQLVASSSSSLPVVFSSSNEEVASVEGNTVTIHGPGITSITASQAGNENYNAATDVVRELQVLLVTGSDDPASMHLELYPNPVNTMLTIKLDGRAVRNMTEAILVDELGKQIILPLKKTSEEGIFEANTAGLARGLYFIFVAADRKGRMLLVAH
ncbi:MAG TPA: choice-of-anchor tandem repeat GloVer-containing protein [Chryseosolibacter sp.]|nr:choice-of-anchor tandem repeat GloVer-containing protein [Chryseosolibacter sp.]